jgi:hypothetical protein
LTYKLLDRQDRKGGISHKLEKGKRRKEKMPQRESKKKVIHDADANERSLRGIPEKSHRSSTWGRWVGDVG